MSQLEVKEKELNKVKQESDQLIMSQHPASDKIEVGPWWRWKTKITASNQTLKLVHLFWWETSKCSLVHNTLWTCMK